jgi:NCAIR mutase (PurE)-related protein
MDSDQLRGLLEQVQAGAVNVEAAIDRLRHMPFEDLGYAKLDHHRQLRHGLTEVVFGKGKTPEQVAAIAARLLDKSANVLVTRADREAADLLKAKYPDAEHFPLSGAVRVWRDRTIRGKGKLAVPSTTSASRGSIG